MPTINRDASGRFTSITSNPVRLSTSNFSATENTTMPRRNYPSIRIFFW